MKIPLLPPSRSSQTKTMYNDESNYRRYPRVPIDRRVGAFAIDFLTIWLVSSFFGSVWILQGLVFFVAWLAMQIIVVDKNRGQSLGKWAMDIKVIAPRYNRIPDLTSLFKREAILGVGAMLAMYGLQINVHNGLSMLILLCPVLIDCGLAIADEDFNLAFHDRVAETMVVQTKRGFSLDLRIKKLIAQIQRRMRR